MKKLLFWFFPVMALLVPLHTIAQKSDPSFRHLTIEDGLSQGAVYALYQDNRGFIWIGTKDGLNKYDGYRFSIFQHNPFDSTTLSSSYITEILEDSRGFLWVGTLEGGLNRMDRSTERFHRYQSDPEKPGSLSDNRITAIAEDSSGGLWIGTPEGLNYLPASEIGRSSPPFQKIRKDVKKPRSLSSNDIKTIMVDWAGGIWIGTSDGVNYLKASEVGTSSPRFRHYRTTDGLMDEMIFAIHQTRDGTVWAGSISGLNRYLPQSDTFTQFPHHYQIFRRGWGQIVEMEEDGYGRLWLATPGELMIFDRNSESYRYIRPDPLVPTSLSSNGITRIIRDKSGVLWLATNGYGLNLYDPKADRFDTYRRPRNFPSRISRFSITAILEDRNGNIWISADVLYRWNRTTGELKCFETDSEHPGDFGNTGVWSMLQDSSGSLWMASFEGLYRYDPLTGNYRHFTVVADPSRGLRNKVALNVFNDREGRIWVATENFFSRYNPSTDRFIHYRYRQKPATRSASFTATYQDPQGIFWLATDDGLVRFNSETETFRYFRTNPSDPHSLASNVVLSIHADPRNPAVLWLGTAGGGLNRFDKTSERFEHYTEEQGLPNNVVYGVLPDETGNLWLSTNKGLSRFNPTTGEFRNFDVRDGLQSNEFNTGAYFKSRSGEMFFGGVMGLSYFFPLQIRDNPHIPNVVITSLRIFNREATPETNPEVLKHVISQSNDITLSYRQNVVSFEFAALDYSSSSRNQYAYKMEGFNEDWIPAGASRTATFTNLPAGSYRFRVKGSNNDGVWNESGTSLVVHVTPPPWRSWWAYSLYFLAVLGLLYGVRRYEMNRLRLKNRLRVEQLEGEKLRDMDQMKTRFFANISHEFRTPLTLILGQIDRVLGTAAGKEEKRRLEVALGNARRLLRLINQLLDLSKLEANSMPFKAEQKNIIPFLKNLIYSFESLAEQKGIILQFQSSENCIELSFEPDKLEKVFYNLLSNAIKFTPEGGQVAVAVEHTPPSIPPLSKGGIGGVEICVNDTGSGISRENLPHIFNRFYQGNDSNTREHEGTGIGLALAKELVELHGGEISVTSEVGKGTAFTVYLPLGKEHLRDEEIADSCLPPSGKSDLKKPTGTGHPITGIPGDDSVEVIHSLEETPNSPPDQSAIPNQNSEIVLIVEDHPDVRAYISDQLTGSYQVLKAMNGEEGVKIARERIPDLIITDVMMPKMDGYQLSAVLREDEKTCHIPIIMLTAKAGMEDKIEGLETGVDDYLTKPFSAKELSVRVANLIDMRRKLRKRFRQKTIVKPSEVTATPMDQEFLEKVLTTVTENIGEEQFDVAALAQMVGMSVSQLNRKLRALIDQPAGQMLRSMRLQRAADLLKQNAGTVAEICYEVGFGDQANFTRAFKKQFGVSPGSYRQKVN